VLTGIGRKRDRHSRHFAGMGAIAEQIAGCGQYESYGTHGTSSQKESCVNGAAALITMLTQYQVEYIFGVPGDTNVALYQALKADANAPRHIMCRDERSAVFMADCYARLTGKPGVVEVPSGAGAMYALPGVAEADRSSVPLILLVNDIPRSGVGRGTLTELPVADLFRPIANYCETLSQIEKLPEVVRRAFRCAAGGRPGASVLALPEDVLYETLPIEGVSLHVEERCARAPSHRSRPDDRELDEALAALLSARRPLIVAGGGANRSGAQTAVREFAERLSIPVAVTITGQGVVPDGHPLAIGVIGDNGFHPHALWALEEADFIVYVGCRMGSVATMNGTSPKKKQTRILQIDIADDTLANTYEVDFALAGDARATVEALAGRAQPGARPDWIAWTTQINRRRSAFWDDAASALHDHVPLRPERVMDALSRRLKGRVNVISDAGTPTPYATRFLTLGDSRSRLIIPRFFGGLGYAIPGVIGAHFAEPETQVVGLFGDGSLGMSAGELETIARLQIPVVLVHFNNACFGWIKALQRVHAPSTDNDGVFQVDFGKHDMRNLAQVYGIRGYRVENADDLEAALDEAFALNEPCFLDVVVESIADRFPPVMSWLKRTAARANEAGVAQH
jgi:acetolactate synthase-1/2/3 large subunit